MSVIFINPYRFGRLWTPADIATALWLDAADAGTVAQGAGQVTTWSDKSGNNQTATASGNPTYSATGMSTGTPAVQLDGTGDSFVSSIAGIGSFNALDVYMVFQTSAAAAADANSGIFWGYGNNGLGNSGYPPFSGTQLISSTGALSGELITFVSDSTTENSGRLGSSTYNRAANAAQMLNSRFSQSGSSLIVNGSTVSLNLANQITTSSNSAPSSKGYTLDSNLYIGASRSNGALQFSPAIKFAEVVVTSTLLSTTTRQQLEGYLAWKWGLVANLPSNHPFKSAAPTA